MPACCMVHPSSAEFIPRMQEGGSLSPFCPFCSTCSRPVGSGKSSLLNALAGRLPKGGCLEGEVGGALCRSGWSRKSPAGGQMPYSRLSGVAGQSY